MSDNKNNIEEKENVMDETAVEEILQEDGKIKSFFKSTFTKANLKAFFLNPRWIKLLVVIIVLVVAGKLISKKFMNKEDETSAQIRTATVSKQDISNTLEASGTISPLNQYDVTSLVQGEVIECTFEEGDQVEKGDVLYQISTEDVDKNIRSSKKSLKRAKENYQEAQEDMADMNIKSNASGYIKKLYVEQGDSVQAGNKIADIYDNTYMDLEVQFSVGDAKANWVGKKATVTMETTGDTMKGTVTAVSSVTSVLSGNRVVCSVTIQVKNPGGIAAGDTATAKINGVMCSAAGSFEVKEETELTATTSGDIDVLLMKEGSYVKKNQVVINLSSEEMENRLQSAKEQYEDAKEQYENQLDSLEDYTITAPISGEIITKNTKTGDNISMGSSGASVLATIYDLSAVTFEMSIDELDVLNVKEKMKVTVTADALEGQTYSGYVQNISLESSAMGGVTQYPVTVKINKVGDLLPGMNVTGEIVLESVTDVMAIPSSALQRGDVVYVKDIDAATQDTEEGRGKIQSEENGHQTPPDFDANGEKREMPEGESDGNRPDRSDAVSGETKSSEDSGEKQREQDTKKSDSSSDKQRSNIPDGFHAVSVETGLDNGDYIEIKSGLEEGDIVYIPTTETTNDNMAMFGMNGQQNQGGMSGMGGMSGGNMSGGGNRPGGGNRSGGGGMPVGR